MTLSELGRWGVTKKVWIQGERRDFFTAEGNIWKMISRVFSERERVEILDAIDAMEEALDYVRAKAQAGTPAERARAQLQLDRIAQLLELAKLGRTLLDRLLAKGMVDASPLLEILLGKTSS